jgi:hypothetical protein
MKARVKATGVIVEVSLSHIVYDGGRKIIWYNTPQGASFTEDELEFIDTEENFDYWTRLEHQAAIAAMQGKMAQGDNFGNSREEVCNKIANYCIDVAETLIKKLKKKEEKK